jgi:hypothetical protein
VTAPMSERDFLKLVKDSGLQVDKSGKEWKIVDASGQYLMSFAVAHSKGGKREVKPVYIRQFRKLIEG